MRIERAILRRLASGNNRGDFFISNELLKEIEALLAQPETEQEPVVWQVIGIAGFMYVYNKPIDQVYEHHTVNALYLAPPKREPLSDAEVLKIATKVCLEDMGVEMNPKDFKDTGVFELSRAIEKAHGIGEDDE